MSWFKNISVVFVSLVVVLLILELGLRFFPVISDGLVNRSLLSDQSKPFEVALNKNIKFEYSKSWNFQNSRVRKTNNLGFFSDYDYELGHKGVFVVGDSFIVAMEVDFDQTFHQLLATSIGEKIYNVGLSGAPLSQYEAYVSQICTDFVPTKILIPIIENDFDESMFSFRKEGGFRGFFFLYKNGELTPSADSDSATKFYYTARKILKKSALVRYLFSHIIIRKVLQGLIKQGTPNNLAITPDFSLHNQATDLFLQRIKNYCLSPENFVFIVDAKRSMQGDVGIYNKDNPKLPYMEYFIHQARAGGFTVVDLTPVLRADFEKNGKRFEFAFDGHWNDYAHKLIAEHLLKVVDF